MRSFWGARRPACRRSSDRLWVTTLMRNHGLYQDCLHFSRRHRSCPGSCPGSVWQRLSLSCAQRRRPRAVRLNLVRHPSRCRAVVRTKRFARIVRLAVFTDPRRRLHRKAVAFQFDRARCRHRDLGWSGTSNVRVAVVSSMRTGACADQEPDADQIGNLQEKPHSRGCARGARSSRRTDSTPDRTNRTTHARTLQRKAEQAKTTRSIKHPAWLI